MFNVSVSDLEEGMGTMLIKFTNDIKGRPTDTLESQGAF